MNYKLVFHELAIQEAKDAYEYYEMKQTGLGIKFNKEIEKGIVIIQNNPKHYRKIKNEVRQYKIATFPFVFIYKILEDVVLILCIFHTSRNPKYKIRK